MVLVTSTRHMGAARMVERLKDASARSSHLNESGGWRESE